VFPSPTGDENYIGGAVETVEGIRVIKQALPDVANDPWDFKCFVWIAGGRARGGEFGFLYYCTKAGLDLAIVNTEKLERFASIPEHERELAEKSSLPASPKRSMRKTRAPGC